MIWIQVLPCITEKKTNDDDELVGLVGLLENKSKAHILNESSRSISNVETSEFDFMERGEQDNKAWQTFPDDLSKSEQHDPTQTKLSVYSWRFYGDDETLGGRIQASFYSEYPWIEYSVKENAPFWSCWRFWGKECLNFSIVLRE